MHKRPLAVVAIFFIIGAVLGKFVQSHISLIQTFYAFLFFIVATIIFVRFNKIAHTFLFLSVTSFAALLYINSNIFSNNHISHVLGEEKIKTDIVGIIKSPTLTRKPYYGKINSTYLFDIEQIEDKSVEGLAQIRVQTEKDYGYGDRLMVKGTIKRPFESVIASEAKQSQKKKIASSSVLGGLLAMTPRKDFNYREYLENQNIFAIINANEKNVTLLLHNYRINPVIRFAYVVREKLKNQFLERMPLETGAFMRAILLGDRSELPKDVQQAFKDSGTMHIIAISGLNVGLIAAFFIYFFKLIRVWREISYVITMFFLVFLTLLTGSTPSVVRATIMCIVFLVGMLLGRAVDPYNTLAIAALFVLVKNPKDVFDVGFQLSFLAVLSMIYFTPRLTNVLKKDMNFYVKKYLWLPFAVSISASIGTFPLILYYFRMFVPISIISNIFIVPLMFVLMIGGLCFSVLAWVPFAGAALANFNNILAGLIFFLAEFFSGIKFGHFYI